jgi:hypothetical protein
VHSPCCAGLLHASHRFDSPSANVPLAGPIPYAVPSHGPPSSRRHSSVLNALVRTNGFQQLLSVLRDTEGVEL